MKKSQSNITMYSHNYHNNSPPVKPTNLNEMSMSILNKNRVKNLSKAFENSTPEKSVNSQRQPIEPPKPDKNKISENQRLQNELSHLKTLHEKLQENYKSASLEIISKLAAENELHHLKTIHKNLRKEFDQVKKQRDNNRKGMLQQQQFYEASLSTAEDKLLKSKVINSDLIKQLEKLQNQKVSVSFEPSGEKSLVINQKGKDEQPNKSKDNLDQSLRKLRNERNSLRTSTQKYKKQNKMYRTQRDDLIEETKRLRTNLAESKKKNSELRDKITKNDIEVIKGLQIIGQQKKAIDLLQVENEKLKLSSSAKTLSAKYLNLKFGSLTSLSKIDAVASEKENYSGRWCPPVPYTQLEKENIELQTRLAELTSKNEQLKVELEIVKAGGLNEIGVGSSKLIDSTDTFEDDEDTDDLSLALGDYSERLID